MQLRFHCLILLIGLTTAIRYGGDSRLQEVAANFDFESEEEELVAYASIHNPNKNNQAPTARILRPQDGATFALLGRERLTLTLYIQLWNFNEADGVVRILESDSVLGEARRSGTFALEVSLAAGSHTLDLELVSDSGCVLGRTDRIKVEIVDKMAGGEDLLSSLRYVRETFERDIAPLHREPNFHDGHVAGTNRVEILALLTGLSPPKTICETGFMAGYSARLFLRSPTVQKLVTFDLFDQDVSRVARDALRRDFGDRFESVEGDSFYTLPDFVAKHPGFKCDLVFVDGSHAEVLPYSDLRHFSSISDANTVVVADDCGDEYVCPHCIAVAKAWDQMEKEGRLTSLAKFRVLMGDVDRGYQKAPNEVSVLCVGRYLYRDSWGFIDKGLVAETTCKDEKEK